MEAFTGNVVHSLFFFYQIMIPGTRIGVSKGVSQLGVYFLHTEQTSKSLFKN